MANLEYSCRFCTVTSVVCYWGELTTYRPWKRVFAFFGSLALLAISISVVLFEQPLTWFYVVLALGLGLFSMLGLIASTWGCNRCVVRMFGNL